MLLGGNKLVVRKILLWLFVLFALFFVINVIIVLPGIWAAHETQKRLDIGYRTTTSDRMVSLEVGDRFFEIPQNHIWYRGAWRGGKLQGVNMHALLPDFEPYQESNKHEFDRPGWSRKISFLLSEHNIPGSRTSKTSMTREEIYLRIMRRIEDGEIDDFHDKEGPFGLFRRVSENKSQTRELYVGTKPDGSFYWVRCTPEGERLHPSCSTHIEHSEQATIKYTFSRRFLKDWIAIDDGVIDFFSKLDVSDSQGE